MKKIIVFVFVVLFLSLSFVSADILSINSGGDTGLILNPSKFIESFFLGANRFPIASNLILSSSSGTNTTNENLSISYSSSDADGDPITNITDWRLDGSSIAVLNMPFDKRVFSTSSGAIRDYSTYGNNGTLGGGSATPIWSSSCQVGGCYDFKGGDYVDLGSSINPKPFTYSLWFNSTDNTKSIFTKGTKSRGSGSQRIIDLYGTGANINFVMSTGSAYILSTLGGTYPSLNQWHHIVVTWNGTTDANSVKMYLDGNLFDEATPTGTNLGVSMNLYVGGINGGGSASYNGLLDEFLMFNRSLGPEQIKILYNAGLANHNIELLSSNETSKGDVWQVALTPNDVYDDGTTILSNSLTIANVAPNDPTNVLLRSLNERNESDTDLNCSFYISDDDNSKLSVSVYWVKDEVSQFVQQFSNQDNGTLFWTLLGNGNLTLGDFWKCSVRTYDGVDYSNWINSNNLEIIDITPPNVSIISPNSTYNYTNLDLDFNVSIEENENISNCYYSWNDSANVTMNRFNDSYFWYEPSNLIPGTHNVTFWCNDTSNNWGTNFTNFTILDEAAIAIQLSPALAWNVNWSLMTLPADDENATGNNGPNATDYYINVSVTSITADLYVKADGNLVNDDLDEIGLGNETYAVNLTNSTVPNTIKTNMTTNYVKIADSLGDGSVVYMKFYLDAPAGIPAGTYLNNLNFKAVSHGGTP